MLIKHASKTGGKIIKSKYLQEEYLEKEMSRRRMVQTVAFGAVGTWLGASALAACGNPPPPADGGGNDAGPGTDAGADASADTTPPRMPHLVGMGYHESDRNMALQAALAETVGLGMIRRGDSVYLRVNSNSGDPYPYSTSPDTLVAIGNMLRDVGVTDIRVGDRSFWGDPNTAGNLNANGIADAATMIGTSAVAYDNSVNWVEVMPGSTPNWVGTIHLPEPVMTATHIINLTCVKTHFIANFTMNLKIVLGLVKAEDRQRVGNLDNHVTSRLWLQIAQINKNLTPSLCVLDGYQAVISGGPTMNDIPPGAPSTYTGGITGDPKIFIVSTDRIAADVMGISVLRTMSPSFEQVKRRTPFNLPQIQTAIAAGGLGIGGADALDVSGPTVPNLDALVADARS